jgi:hypothetical protein
MVKRFAERFQLWMSDVADEFADKFTAWLLLFVVVMVATDGYTLFSTHQLSLDSLFGTLLMVAFVVMYIRKARWTWIPLMVLAVRFLVYIPSGYERMRPGHIGVKIFAVAFVLLLSAAICAFSFTLRKRFASSTRTI